MEQHIGFLSREGVRQGDPLGPFFFAVGLQAVLTALHEEMKKPDALDAVLADYQPGDAGPLRELCTDDNQQSSNFWISQPSSMTSAWWGPRPLLSLLPNV